MDLANLFADHRFMPEEQDPCDKGLDILSEGFHMYGHALLPGGAPGENHPCVIMLHGLPGYTTNQDLAQALRRLGFVVLNPFYRGAWGSQGCFSLCGMVQDVLAMVQWCQSQEASEQYGIDKNRVFLVGISMGGWAAINGLKHCPAVAGAVAIAPADIGWLVDAQPQIFTNAFQKYGCLKIASPKTLPEEAAACRNRLGLDAQIEKLKDRPLLLIGGKRDTVVPPDRAILPFWETLQKQQLTEDKAYILLDAGHSFANCRIELIRQVARWLLSQL